MTPRDPNPSFPPPGDWSGYGPDAAARALELAPFDATIVEHDGEFVLEITPIDPTEACVSLLEAITTDSIQIMVYDYEPAPSRAADARSVSLAAAATSARIIAAERLHDGAMVIDGFAIRRLLEALPTARLRLCAIDGAIDERDALFVQRAADADASPLDAELRAVMDVEIVNHTTIIARARDRAALTDAVGRALARFVESTVHHETASMSAPQSWQIERLLGVSGRISIRRREIDAYSTSIDVGIGTAGSGDAGPSSRSLIYDLFSDTWHDEP